jgi:hypothetical protein
MHPVSKTRVMEERRPERRLARSRRRPRRVSGSSLDTDKHLAISVREWLQATKSPQEKRRRELAMQRVLMRSIEQLWHAAPGQDHPINPARQGDWERLHNCQSEWIGFRAACCTGKAVAVPVGCNHRLCVLCNSHRAAKYRERVAVLFDQMKSPVLLTLTVPNVRRLSKRTYAVFRKALKTFLKRQNWISGGLYSIETTHNRQQRTWHVHAHILCDSATTLPCSRKVFIRFKRTVEFDWLRLSGGKPPQLEAWLAAVSSSDANGEQGEIGGPERRVIDIRRVNRRGAMFEVLKYITKVSAFSDIPEAVEQFLCAVKHTRMIQTFGSWYGYRFPENVNEPDWSHLQCECGQNSWERIGFFQRGEVEMQADGRWIVKPEYVVFRTKRYTCKSP